MNSVFEEQNGRPPAFKDVEDIMSKLRPPATFNEPILAVEQYEAARIMQGRGYPKDMHHATLPPVRALRKDQEKELRALGYVDYYIPQAYPRVLYRRNMDLKYELKRDPATLEPTNIEWVEERTVASKAAHEQLLHQRVPSGCGPWVETLDEIEALPDGPVEDPNITIARLQGKVAALENQPPAEPRKPRGRPRKHEQVAVA